MKNATLGWHFLSVVTAMRRCDQSRSVETAIYKGGFTGDAAGQITAQEGCCIAR